MTVGFGWAGAKIARDRVEPVLTSRATGWTSIEAGDFLMLGGDYFFWGFRVLGAVYNLTY
ncbi:MAG: hypothetical protein K0Q55_3026 [Verrucomicrobia bacterium]|jgi:hypothetical protein|nr:hypothetical protein [Verrucomicrobiota bacterium]